MRTYLLADVVLGVVVVLVSLAFTRRARRWRNRPRETSLEGFTRTQEIFFDPTTGVKQEVWFNPSTGERRYLPLREDDGG